MNDDREGTKNDETPRPPRKRLELKRETLRNVDEPLLTSQGHSLWTCDASVRLPTK